MKSVVANEALSSGLAYKGAWGLGVWGLGRQGALSLVSTVQAQHGSWFLSLLLTIDCRTTQLDINSELI